MVLLKFVSSFSSFSPLISVASDKTFFFFFFCSHIHLNLRVPFITLSGYSTFNVAFYCVRFTLCYSSQFSFYWHTNIDPFGKFYFCCTLFGGGLVIRHIILTLVCLLHSCISVSLNDFMPHFCALSKLLKNCL